MPGHHAEIYSDGSVDPSTGRAGWACTVICGVRHERSGVLAQASVLLAELYAARVGLVLVHQLGASSATLYTDSTSLVALLDGRVRPTTDAVAIVAVLADIELLRPHLAFHCVWVRAHMKHGSAGNVRADWLARQALGKK